MKFLYKEYVKRTEESNTVARHSDSNGSRVSWLTSIHGIGIGLVGTVGAEKVETLWHGNASIWLWSTMTLMTPAQCVNR